jgi:MOSC domain-containing protein YiiM
MVCIEAIFVGEPQSITDEKGTWFSAIYRAQVSGPIELRERGLLGDRVADTKNHGRPGQAVCVHPIKHYDFWNESYDLKGAQRLVPGSVGENWTISGGTKKPSSVVTFIGWEPPSFRSLARVDLVRSRSASSVWTAS